MHVQETFATNMREFRVRAGLSQEMLAERSGLHRTYIGSIEQLRANISLKNVGRIAKALGQDPAAMFVDGVAARKNAVKDYAEAVDAMICDAPPLEEGAYALCGWEGDGSVRFSPVGVYSEDLTLRVLCILIEEGHGGSLEELVAAYQDVSEPVLDFVRSYKTRELDKKQRDFAERRGMDLGDFGELIGEAALDVEEAFELERNAELVADSDGDVPIGEEVVEPDKADEAYEGDEAPIHSAIATRFPELGALVQEAINSAITEYFATHPVR